MLHASFNIFTKGPLHTELQQLGDNTLTSFCILTFSHHSISHHQPNISIPDTNLLLQLARFSILFGGNFYKQQLTDSLWLIVVV